MLLKIKNLFHPPICSRPEYNHSWQRIAYDEDGRNVLRLTIENHYRNRHRRFVSLGDNTHTSTIDAVTYNNTFSVKYLIDGRYVFRYHIPIDVRNFHAGIDLGVGPEYIGIENLVNQNSKDKFSIESAVEAIVHNLKMLDEYLEGRLR